MFTDSQYKWKRRYESTKRNQQIVQPKLKSKLSFIRQNQSTRTSQIKLPIIQKVSSIISQNLKRQVTHRESGKLIGGLTARELSLEIQRQIDYSQRTSKEVPRIKIKGVGYEDSGFKKLLDQEIIDKEKLKENTIYKDIAQERKCLISTMILKKKESKSFLELERKLSPPVDLDFLGDEQMSEEQKQATWSFQKTKVDIQGVRKCLRDIALSNQRVSKIRLQGIKKSRSPNLILNPSTTNFSSKRGSL